MQYREQLQEIEDMGEEELEEELLPPKGDTVSTVPLIQVALCVLIILALVALKLIDTEKYEEVTEWYNTEINREIELPEWEREEASSVPEESAAFNTGAEEV